MRANYPVDFTICVNIFPQIDDAGSQKSIQYENQFLILKYYALNSRVLFDFQ